MGDGVGALRGSRSLVIFGDPEGGDPGGGDPEGIPEPSRRWPPRPPTERGVKRFAPRSGCQRLTAEIAPSLQGIGEKRHAKAAVGRACAPWWHKSNGNRANDRCSQSDLLGAHVGLRPRRGRASFLAWSREPRRGSAPSSPGLPAPRATLGNRSQKITNPNGVAPIRTGVPHHAMA